ncbi:MAG: sigma-70 family RNA polymerase sigma factor [Bacteroidetes bacterium]|nr:sigma-70 family RNA polymerase sigma factor [Bacteroidota bacterium]
MSDFTDKDILIAFRDENSRNYAFNLLVKKYQQTIYYHIRRIVIDHDDTDDLVQNTFVKIFEHLKDFREDAQLYTWIYRIATNEALAFLKTKRNRSFVSFNDVEHQMSNSLKESQFYNGDEIQLKLQKAILTLPEKQRLVFNMRYYDEMKYEDMSAVLETSVGALKASFHIAVKKIEEIITEH